MYKIIKEKKLETLEKKVATFINTMGCIPSGNVNKLEINGEPMFVQAIYKKVEQAITTKNMLDVEKV